jgi:hypothetical protein
MQLIIGGHRSTSGTQESLHTPKQITDGQWKSIPLNTHPKPSPGQQPAGSWTVDAHATQEPDALEITIPLRGPARPPPPLTAVAPQISQEHNT